MKQARLKLWLSVGVSALTLVTFAASAQAQEAPSETTTDATAKRDDTVVVVTARRKALQSATELKKKSDTMIDSVVADEAGRLPDNSITEVLARIPGVTMSRFNGSGDSFQVEGSGIQIRGLSNPSSMLNGREVFSANGGSGLMWGEVTPELMAAVDVYKATRVDLIEGGTGGSIDLRTKMPFDYKKPAFEGSVGLSKGDLVGRSSPSISALVTKRFDTPVGEMGFLVDVAYSKFLSQTGHLSVEPYYKKLYQGEDRYMPAGFGWGDDHFERERTGLYEAFQWRPNDHLVIFQTFFQTHYTSNNNGTSAWLSSDRLMPTSGDATFDENGVLVTADHMSNASFNDGSAGSTVGQGWLSEDQQVDCNAPYGQQATSLDWGASPPSCAVANSSAGSSRGFSTTDNITRDFSQGFTWTGDRLRARGALQFVDSSAKSTGMSAGLSVPVTGFSVDLSGDTPKFLIDNSQSLTSPASYQWSQISWRPTNNHATMVAANLDADYELGDGFFKTISMGVREANRVEHDNYDGTYWASLGAGWNGSPVTHLSDGPAEDSEYYGFDNFFHNDVPVPGVFYVPSSDLLKSNDFAYIMNTYGYSNTITLADGTVVPVTPEQVVQHKHGGSRTAVKTESVYLMAKFGSETGLFGVPYTGNVGIRYTKTSTEASGNFVFAQSDFYMNQADANADFQADPTGTLTPRAVHLSEDVQNRVDESEDARALPAFNINFKPSDTFFVRLAANQTMSRPSFSDITVAGNGSVTTQLNGNNYTESTPGGEVNHVFKPIFDRVTASIGNTTLKPTIATNFDLSLEWYKSWSTTAHLAFFHKDLKDLIVFGDSVVPFPYDFTKTDGTAVSGVSTLTTSQATNADENATIKGFEFGGRTFFDSLPGFWSGFGIDANFTYIESRNPAPKAYDLDGNRFSALPVVGLSRYTYNLNLMYSKGPLYVGLAYNWRSRFLMGTNTNGTGTVGSGYTYCSDTEGHCETIHYNLPLYGRDYGQLDFGANYKVSDRIRISVQASNLTNEVARSDMEIKPGKFYPRNYYESDRRIEFGLNFAY
ncbi:hypothetical protein MMA231_04068 (plasmid) [Asticcacaulis sp. MM231]|uniref:TonB-dependent receptor n=1 Tax=Asticcacaulis sp. MM231 TaxID=3157666 RepID=UPI0032D59E1A